MVDANANAPEPAPQTGTVIGTVINGAERFSRFSPQQVVHLVLIVAIASLGWLSYSTMTQQVEMRTTELRNSAEREEMIRQHCAVECDKNRQFYAAQLDMQRRHDNDRDDKTRAMLLAHLKGRGGVE